MGDMTDRSHDWLAQAERDLASMPMRSSRSSVLVWPSRDEVDAAVRRWAAAERQRHPALQAVGYFGSYARGDHGVGSDVNLVVIMGGCDRPFAERALDWDTTRMPVLPTSWSIRSLSGTLSPARTRVSAVGCATDRLGDGLADQIFGALTRASAGALVRELPTWPKRGHSFEGLVIAWESAGDVIRVIPGGRARTPEPAARLRLFDQATARQRVRTRAARRAPPTLGRPSHPRVGGHAATSTTVAGLVDTNVFSTTGSTAPSAS